MEHGVKEFKSEPSLLSLPELLAELKTFQKKDVVEHCEILRINLPKSVVDHIKRANLVGSELREIDGSCGSLAIGSNHGSVLEPSRLLEGGEDSMDCVGIRVVILNRHVCGVSKSENENEL